MIVPSVFVFTGGDEAMLQKGAGLTFEMLPKIFDPIPLGNVIGVVFFLLVFFAALTSAISLMETIVSILRDKTGWGRKKACIAVTIFTLVLGIPSSLGHGIWSGIAPLGMSILDFFDFISNSVMMPILAILTCIIVGFILKPKFISDEVKVTDGTFKGEKMFNVMIKWVCPIFLIAILACSVLVAMGLFSF